MNRTRTAAQRFLAFALVVLVGSISGCGYNIGAPFAGDVRTVAVPIFQNNTFRRGIEFQLTEAVQNEIKMRSPFRIADESTAQTRLVGRIMDIRKNVLAENDLDDPRQVQLALGIRVTWEENGSGKILARWDVPLPPSLMALEGTSTLAPEVGQSLATARQQVVQDVARQIVNRMEAPW